MEQITDIRTGERHEMHSGDIEQFIHSILENGYHKIIVEIDTTSEKYFNEGIAGITVMELSERYDRVPAMASL
jgi:hypothetical protein